MQLLGGMSRYLSVPLAAVGRLGAGPARELPPRRALPAGAQLGLRRLRDLGRARPPRLGRRRQGAGRSRHPAHPRRAPRRGGDGRDDAGAVGLAFIQSYAVDKRLHVKDLRYERVDVIVGAVLTGVIGFFVVVACAATLHVQGVDINDARDAARALEPLAGNTAATLFGLGFLGAALLAAAIVPLSTAYSISETFGRKADLNDTFSEARAFYLSYGAVVAVAAVLVLIPGAPLIPILFLSQALNAVLLLVLLPFMRSLGKDSEADGRLRPAAHRQARDRHRLRADRRIGAGARGVLTVPDRDASRRRLTAYRRPMLAACVSDAGSSPCSRQRRRRLVPPRHLVVAASPSTTPAAEPAGDGRNAGAPGAVRTTLVAQATSTPLPAPISGESVVASGSGLLILGGLDSTERLGQRRLPDGPGQRAAALGRRAERAAARRGRRCAPRPGAGLRRRHRDQHRRRPVAAGAGRRGRRRHQRAGRRAAPHRPLRPQRGDDRRRRLRAGRLRRERPHGLGPADRRRAAVHPGRHPAGPRPLHGDGGARREDLRLRRRDGRRRRQHGDRGGRPAAGDRPPGRPSPAGGLPRERDRPRRSHLHPRRRR